MNRLSLKKKLMEYLWRLQASQVIIGLIAWSLMLTGIFYPYIKEKTGNFGFPLSEVLLGMTIMFLATFGGILLIGILFDKLKFWREQNIVMVERNPYMSYKLAPKEIYWIKIWLMAVREIPDKSEELKKEIDFYEKWMEKSLKEDGKLSEEVENIEKWVKK